MAWAVLTIEGKAWDVASDVAIAPGETATIEVLGPAKWWELDILGRTAALSVSGVVRLTGTVARMRHGSEQESCELQIRPAAAQPAAKVPSVDVVVSEERWTAPSEKALGQHYPRILGYPGDMGGSNEPHPIVPVVLVEYPSSPTTANVVGLLCDVGPLTGDSAQEVYLLTEENGEGWGEILHTTDALGAPCCTVQWDSPGATAGAGYATLLPASADDGVYAGFSSSHSTTESWTTLLEGLDGFDRSSSQAALNLLSGYRVDVALNEPVDPWEYFSGLLQYFPVLLSTAQDGRLFLRVDGRVFKQASRCHLYTERADLFRLSDVEVDGNRAANRFFIEYRQGRDSQYLSNVSTSAADSLSVQSIALYGLVEESIQLPWCWNDATAELVAQTALARAALPFPVVRYRLPQDGPTLDVGDTITLTDEEVGLFGRDAHVADVRELPTGQEVELHILRRGSRAAPTATAAASISLLSAPTMSSVAYVEGGIVTHNDATWDSTPATRTYQWRRDGVDISGATSSTYTPVLADVGAVLSCVESVTASGGASNSATSTAAQTVAGIVRSFDFDRDGALQSAAALAISGSHTVAFWARVDDFSAGHNFFSTSDNDAGDHWLTLFQTTSQWVRRRVGGSGNLDHSGTGIITAGTWYHWVCVYDASANQEIVYLDGVQLGSIKSTSGFTHTAALAFIWASRDSAAATAPVGGRMADLRIYDVAKDSSEAAALAAENGLSPDTTGLVSRLAETGTTGTTATYTERVSGGPSWSTVGTAPTLEDGPSGLYVRP